MSPESPDGYLQAVSADSASDAWAVGGTSWSNPSRTLALHWDGTSWTVVATPVQGGSATFAGVAATSGANAWAVGSIGSSVAALLGVAVIGGDDVWAAGTVDWESALIEHWGGSTWRD